MPTDLAALHGQTASLPSLRISEIVLQTARYAEMKAWYQAVLGTRPFLERVPEAPVAGSSRASDITLCFMRVHADFPWGQILAIFGMADLSPPTDRAPGLNHMQFRHGSLPDLFDRYEILRAAGIRPERCANHGPGTSFYYRDPDQNRVELNASNFTTEADYTAFLRSPAFRANPSGVDVDGDAFVARFRAGVPQAQLILLPA
jgi:catechol 2,3-dioxygenase-like lactoylglutathione lyase family enzyme